MPMPIICVENYLYCRAYLIDIGCQTIRRIEIDQQIEKKKRKSKTMILIIFIVIRKAKRERERETISIRRL